MTRSIARVDAIPLSSLKVRDGRAPPPMTSRQAFGASASEIATLSTTAPGVLIEDAIGAAFTLRQHEPFAVPAWVRKRAARGRFEFESEGDRLATCLAAMYPRGLTPTRGEVAHLCSAACSIPADDCEDGPTIIRRAADAAERLFRKGFTLPAETITRRRAMIAALQETTADD